MTKKITTSAILIALSTVLSAFPILRLPNDGTVTLASMVPVIIIGILYGTKQGLLSAFVFSVLQMITAGVATPPTQNFLSYLLVVLLDYIVAFTVLGTSGMFYKLFKNNKFSIPISGIIVVIFRFLCHFISGIVIWDVYAPSDSSPILYSFIYNGSYMGIELLTTAIILFLLTPFIKKQFR